MRSDYSFVGRLRAVSDRDVTRLRELFLDLANQFDPETMADHLLFPEEMTWFYGEPIFHEMSEEQRLKLNRLTFCQNYLSTLVAEAATNVLNYESALAALIRSDPEAGFYMAREVVEETFHLESFYIILRKVLEHYGIPFEEYRARNHSLGAAVAYQRFHTALGWLRGSMGFYYLTRYPLNVSQKTIERSTIEEPRMHPLVRTLLKNHAIDEARHMRMSREAGKLALREMSRPVRSIASFFYAHYAARIDMAGRLGKGNKFSRQTRTSVLEMCGVPRERALRAYREWRGRVNQPHDPPHVQRARLYYLRLNQEFVDEWDLPDGMKRYVKNVIARAYTDVIQAEQKAALRPLEFGDLERPN
jgi:hypothetical protein